MTQSILVDKKTNHAFVKLNRPHAHNAFDGEMIDGLVDIVNGLDADPDIRCIVFAGEGKSFCAGGDFKMMKNKDELFSGDSNQLRVSYKNSFQKLARTMEALTTPTMAVIDGAAVGAGSDFACMCDLRLGTSRANFSVSFSLLGLVPGDGGTFFLPRVIGYSRAMEMLLTGKVINCEKALEWGLLNEKIEEGQLEKTIFSWVEQLCRPAPVAISMIKEAMKNSVRLDLQASLSLLAAFQGIAQRTQDHDRGVEAVINKTTPEFKNH